VAASHTRRSRNLNCGKSITYAYCFSISDTQALSISFPNSSSCSFSSRFTRNRRRIDHDGNTYAVCHCFAISGCFGISGCFANRES
jgi:hypothetical protein